MWTHDLGHGSVALQRSGERMFAVSSTEIMGYLYRKNKTPPLANIICSYQSRYFVDLNVRSKAIKLLEDYLHDLGKGKDF